MFSSFFCFRRTRRDNKHKHRRLARRVERSSVESSIFPFPGFAQTTEHRAGESLREEERAFFVGV